ncbi:aldo/keto reductase [Tateyamaria omphalii]|uniref:aldo/keto reductase n=1 Tax=Tateyamaria omphalii TaxID=299262 RepID=UPI001C9998CB|nr:aldo/keto reductase [Tateyamaria omphalii]MBY5932703.1 aldo/keto reductase [Tateyamaria omphalii]
MTHVHLGAGPTMSRVIKGGWQLAGGHGQVDRTEAIADMIAFCDAGITTFDCADIYTGVEDLIGAFRTEYQNLRGAEAARAIRVHTKYVPNLENLTRVTRADVEAAIDTSLTRLRTDQLDLVQFHWWDYELGNLLEVAGWLTDLHKSGKILNLGGTNFDTAHSLAMVEAGMPLVSMQVQYSLLDNRPTHHMVDAFAPHDIQLICYGSVAGGLLSDRWLGQPEMTTPYENRSLTKYKLMIDEFGGWSLFQDLLQALRDVADRHDTDIATVASRTILDRPGVGAVIVGARNRSHLPRNLEITTLTLTDQDRQDIQAVLAHAQPIPGDVFDLERDRSGRHGSIMKYNLNTESA